MKECPIFMRDKLTNEAIEVDRLIDKESYTSLTSRLETLFSNRCDSSTMHIYRTTSTVNGEQVETITIQGNCQFYYFGVITKTVSN